VQTLLNCTNSENTSAKNSHVFFHMLFWGSAKPSFGWYKVTSRSNLAATPTIRRLGAPKLGTSLIFMSSLGRNTDWVETLIRYNSKILYKPVKKSKIRYIRYNKNKLYPDFPKSIFNRLRSSDATCCASMAVNTCFFSY
jgi:hypothetical protein